MTAIPRYQRPITMAVPISASVAMPPPNTVTIMSPMTGPPIMRHAMPPGLGQFQPPPLHHGPPGPGMIHGGNMMRPPPMGLPPGKWRTTMFLYFRDS